MNARVCNTNIAMSTSKKMLSTLLILMTCASCSIFNAVTKVENIHSKSYV